MTGDRITPMMSQWRACKEEAGEGLLLFRLGDFYEAFHDDAVTLAEELGLTLTKRQGVPMSGVPAHAAEGYVEKLAKRGFAVAIAEQVTEPTEGKGLVTRKVVRKVTPGTLLTDSSLTDHVNNFFAILLCDGALSAVAAVDLSTGELRVTECEEIGSAIDELFRLSPSELLVAERDTETLSPLLEELRRHRPFRLTTRKETSSTHRSDSRRLIERFGFDMMDRSGLLDREVALKAVNELITHLEKNLRVRADHIGEIKHERLSRYMSIDKPTQRNLELIRPLYPENGEFTLLRFLDKTVTASGKRLFRSWICYPLLSESAIKDRLDCVEECVRRSDKTNTLRTLLKRIGDVERLIVRASMGTITPARLLSLRTSLEPIVPIKALLASFTAPLLRKLEKHLVDPTPLITSIGSALLDEPAAKPGEGKVIRPGFHTELDELLAIKTGSERWLADYQTKLREETGINTLKIIFSRPFGYCIEIGRARLARNTVVLPERFHKRQTLTNAERFTSPELGEFEEKILQADERIRTLELSLYHSLCVEVGKHFPIVKRIARAIAGIDALTALAQIAQMPGYSRPRIDTSDMIVIREGRHPVIADTLAEGHFIPNDTRLSERERMMLITGPNMAGKSTYIRQVALIVIMAHVGSYVPAKEAHIGIVDKVFSRIGASDDLASGRSTFMVEMSETKNILENATPRSLVILDEIGRGTSTYDGISIAWAVAEYLLARREKGVKTLFATHYFELAELARIDPRVKNFTVPVRESDDEIVFLRKITEGIADKSYGIHVARLAGLPPDLIARAEAKADELEGTLKTL